MNNVKYFLTRFIGKSMRFLFTYLNPFNLFENSFIKKKKSQKAIPPVFIVGAPRSGTTLLYQLLTYHYKFSYFSNFTSMFIKSPVLIGYLTCKFRKPYDDNSLSSDYGLMKGTWAPSEAGKIFKHWFLRKNDEKIRNSIYALSDVFKAPFLAKNLRINAELEYVHQLFPNAVFIHIERDLLFNAQSLILGIRENNTDLIGNITENKQRPTITKASKDHVFEQVVDDIHKMNHSIRSFFNRPGVNGISVDYYDLCNNYQHELQHIQSYLKKKGVQLQTKKEFFDLSVQASKEVKLKMNDWKILKQIIEKKNEYTN